MGNNQCASSSTAIEQLADRIETEMGLSFPLKKRRDLDNAIREIAVQKGFVDAHTCIDWLLAGAWSKEKTDLCAQYLTIGETYFFREPRAYGLVADYARKKLKENRLANAPLRIWSAGCCTGEEPYSIAMMLEQDVPELPPDRISILATDINTGHLDTARKGIYRQWSFRNASPSLQKLNFTKEHDNRFHIRDRIKNMVTFAELNLAASVYPSATTNTQELDIIFCRNVLMYFSKPQMKRVIERFRRCLVDGGWLVVNPSEASSELFSGFSGFYYPDAIYFQKNSVTEPVRSSAPAWHQGSKLIIDTQGGISHDRNVVTDNKLTRFPMNRAATRASSTSRVREKERIQARRSTTNVSKISDPATCEVLARAGVYINEGKAEAAARLLNEAISSAPARYDLYQAKAVLAMESGDLKEAMQDLKRVLYLKPDFILAHYLLGVLQSAQHKHAAARRQFAITTELLAGLDKDEIVPGSDGLSAAYLREAMQFALNKDTA